MPTVDLAVHQLQLAARPPERRIFLEGPAGTGKTTTGVARLQHLLAQGIPAHAILVLVPQRSLGEPYHAALTTPELATGGLADVLTLGGIAQRTVELFWPLAAEHACFAHPDRPPVFLTLETAQYYMARLVEPLLKQGYFDTITIERNRLYSQIVDNLNKAAVVGFPYTDIAGRLKESWIGDKSQRRVYDEAQECAHLFREYCLAHNLLDFSLQLEVFIKHLWPLPQPRAYLLGRYTHLIVDNVEEDTAVAHDILREWLPACRSALLIYDRDAGYRRFLGADPGTAYMLRDQCPDQVSFTTSYVTSPGLRALLYQVARGLNRLPATQPPSKREGPPPSGQGTPVPADIRPVLAYEYHRYYPQMIDWVGQEIAGLVEGQGVAPGQIAVLVPFLGDALRFLLTETLQRRGIATRSHRPSRALREEPATRCMLTLAALAHPAWDVCPAEPDVAHALLLAIDGLDLVRAGLLANVLYRTREGIPTLGSFDRLNPEMQERITYRFGERYEWLRAWLETYRAEPPLDLDHFLSRLFGELLAQRGYGFHANYDAGEVAANLIESVRKFRRVAEGGEEIAQAEAHEMPASRMPPSPIPTRPLSAALLLGREYLAMVQDGVVAAQYVRSWHTQPENAVLLMPAHTFLMANRPVDYQFWLDIASPGWWERLNQPLTQPYVLSRAWLRGTLWTDANEFEARQEALYALAAGLIRRCRRKIYLGLSELGEQGVEQQGPLLRVIQQVLRRLQS